MSPVIDVSPFDRHIKVKSDDQNYDCLYAGQKYGVSQSVVDSGATSHMHYLKKLFINVKELPPYTIKFGDNFDVEGKIKGTVEMPIDVK